MIKSKTKYQVNRDDIEKIFARFSLGDVSEMTLFGGGEFNSACKVAAIKNGVPVPYVVKLSPPEDANVLTYEKNMMSAEVYWYEQIRKNTDIRIPIVYLFDDTKEIIPVNYFVMEYISGEPLYSYDLSEKQRDSIKREKLRMLSQIHKITGDFFGYYQGEHFSTWYEAIRSMVNSLITDCEAIGKETPDGHALLEAIDRHKNILEKVPCRMVNFDLWDSNVLLENGKKPVWIDPERSFYGDPIGDMITQGKSQMAKLSEKEDAIRIYNEYASQPFGLNEEEKIRYAVMVSYLALIEEVEKYVRYETTDENYIRNTKDARAMYDMAFDFLK